MNTLLLCPELFASEGGIPRILRLYLRALCEEAATTVNSQVDLVVLNDETISPTGCTRYGNERLRQRIACRRSKARFALATLRLGRQNDRIVCGHVRQLALARAAKTLRPALHYYLVAHGIDVWRPFGPLERWALRGARRIFCVSDYTRLELKKNCPALQDQQLVVLPNALDPAFKIGASPSRLSRNTIFTLSRLNSSDAYKGIDHLIAALPFIRRELPQACLRIAGTGDDMSRLQHLAQKADVNGAVEFLGFVEEEKLPAAFAGCDVFALPSRKEGFGIVFLEAMARGKPCIGARAGGIPEVINESCGLLVDYGDVLGLASACLSALHRSWDTEAILDRARYFSYENFRARLAGLW